MGMKSNLESQMADFDEQVKSLRLRRAAVPRQFTPDAAYEVVDKYRASCKAARNKQAALKPGLNVFGIEVDDPLELVSTETDLGRLEAIWGLAKEWETFFATNSTGVFRTLKTEEMEADAGGFSKRIGRLGRDMKNWKA